MEACESQQQLHGDGLHLEHCVRCGQRMSSVVLLPCWKAGVTHTLTLPWLLHLLNDECKGSPGSCGEPVYEMHLSIISMLLCYFIDIPSVSRGNIVCRRRGEEGCCCHQSIDTFCTASTGEWIGYLLTFIGNLYSSYAGKTCDKQLHVLVVVASSSSSAAAVVIPCVPKKWAP